MILWLLRKTGRRINVDKGKYKCQNENKTSTKVTICK